MTCEGSLGDGVGNHAGEQANGANRVVVARHSEVDLVRVAVGVEDRHNWDVELAGLADREMFLLGVDNPNRRGDTSHLLDATQRALELVVLAAHHEQLLLGVTAAGHVVEVDLLQFLEALETLVDGREVGEHSAQPALVHIGHTHALCLLSDGLLGLLLGAYEHHGTTVRDGLLDEVVCAVNPVKGCLEVNDVDAIALSKNEALHLGVPAAGLVPEVHSRLEHLAHANDGHCTSFQCGKPHLVPRLSPGTCSSRRLPTWVDRTVAPRWAPWGQSGARSSQPFGCVPYPSRKLPYSRQRQSPQGCVIGHPQSGSGNAVAMISHRPYR